MKAHIGLSAFLWHVPQCHIGKYGPGDGDGGDDGGDGDGDSDDGTPFTSRIVFSKMMICPLFSTKFYGEGEEIY